MIGCVQVAADQSDSESDSDDDYDDYETIYLECPANTQPSFGHVVYDVSRPTTAGVISPTSSTSGLADKSETEIDNGGRVTRNMKVGGLGNSEQDFQDPVVVIWRSYNTEQEEPEPEVQMESDHVTRSVSLMLPCLEEVFSMYLFYFSFTLLVFS